MRILVTGKNGQLGRSIHKLVNTDTKIDNNQSSDEFIFVGREELDLSNESNISHYFSNNDKFDKSTNLRVNYSNLKKIDLIKPCLKRYLASNVRTKFRKVEADEFMVATLLPVQRFKKQSDSHVFAKSRGMI